MTVHRAHDPLTLPNGPGDGGVPRWRVVRRLAGVGRGGHPLHRSPGPGTLSDDAPDRESDGVDLGPEQTDEGQVAVALGVVEAVAHDEL